MTTDNDEFGEIPAWLAEARRQWDAIDAAKNTDLAKCQDLIARLRAGLMAAVPAIRHGSPLNEVETLLWDIANAEPLGEKQRLALRRLELEAGYIADSNGDAIP